MKFGRAKATQITLLRDDTYNHAEGFDRKGRATLGVWDEGFEDYGIPPLTAADPQVACELILARRGTLAAVRKLVRALDEPTDVRKAAEALEGRL